MLLYLHKLLNLGHIQKILHNNANVVANLYCPSSNKMTLPQIHK
jgi:hypothetical protein